MNFALPAIIIFFLLIPGFLVRQTIRKTNYGLLESQSFYADLIFGTFGAFVIHASAYYLVNNYLIYWFEFREVNILIVLKLLTDGLSKDFPNSILDVHQNISNNFILITEYFIAINFFALFLGWILQKVILRLGLDLYVKSFRFDNDWSYMLTGRITQCRGYKMQRYEKIHAVQAHVLCTVGTCQMLYTGFISDYQLANKGLEFISIYSVTRRVLKDQSDKEPRDSKPYNYFEINSSYIIFHSKDITNINLTYIGQKKEESKLSEKLRAVLSSLGKLVSYLKKSRKPVKLI